MNVSSIPLLHNKLEHCIHKVEIGTQNSTTYTVSAEGCNVAIFIKYLQLLVLEGSFHIKFKRGSSMY